MASRHSSVDSVRSFSVAVAALVASRQTRHSSRWTPTWLPAACPRDWRSGSALPGQPSWANLRTVWTGWCHRVWPWRRMAPRCPAPPAHLPHPCAGTAEEDCGHARESSGSSQGAGRAPGSDHYAHSPPGDLVDWQERDSHEFSRIGTDGIQDICELSAPCRGVSWQSEGLVDTSFMQRGL